MSIPCFMNASTITSPDFSATAAEQKKIWELIPGIAYSLFEESYPAGVEARFCKLLVLSKIPWSERDRAVAGPLAVYTKPGRVLASTRLVYSLISCWSLGCSFVKMAIENMFSVSL